MFPLAVNHVHLKGVTELISVVAETVVRSCEIPSKEIQSIIQVAGTKIASSNVSVLDLCVKIAARELYCKALNAWEVNSESASHCVTCKRKFLDVLASHELEMSLRIMEALNNKNLPSSCECIRFNPGTKNVEVLMRKSASLETQQSTHFPSIYFGPFSQVCEVQQRQFAISSSRAKKSVLATWHLADCIAIVAFDKVHKVGFLFHVDEGSNIRGAIKELLVKLRLGGERQFSFEYLLVGGVAGSEQKKEYIGNLFAALSTSSIGFVRKSYVENVQIPFDAFAIDSYWSRAVRLCRSVAIDLSKEDPLSQLMGYEAELNPHSAFHARQQTLDEADEFCRRMGPHMECVLSHTL